jgi:hypothetical protein
LEKFKPLLEKSKWNAYLKSAFPKDPSWNTETIGIFSDVNKCYKFYSGKPMEGTEEMYPWMKYTFGVYYFYKNFVDPDVTKLKTTNLANMILKKMDENISGSKNS